MSNTPITPQDCEPCLDYLDASLGGARPLVRGGGAFHRGPYVAVCALNGLIECADRRVRVAGGGVANILNGVLETASKVGGTSRAADEVGARTLSGGEAL